MTVMGEQSGRRKKRLTRKQIAYAMLFLVAISAVVGRLVYRSKPNNQWHALLVGGQPVVARFVCGNRASIDCTLQATITYSKRDDEWCAYPAKNGSRISDAASWCNANPERGTISVYGTELTFDSFGALTKEGQLVGQLFVP